MEINVTEEQFKQYRKVQDSGQFNMLSPNAVEASGLDDDTYFEIIEHFSELYDKYEGCK